MTKNITMMKSFEVITTKSVESLFQVTQILLL